MCVLLNSGQIPIVQSRYLNYFHKNEHPYGENIVIAVLAYTGYNMEDAVIFNKGSIDRGCFRTTYYNSYQTKEETTMFAGGTSDITFIVCFTI